ncbi:carboxymuconolactone decarboxylase family protein [Paenibacillus sp. PsM32]|uniref:carboxymuconolactone decarboxylase family protein n=1 Tax=unclassified Paenibacillus TaxID=185978 RepID=UPI0023669726|nr:MULTISPECIES: carboxymuconolactone decarboxylase family protein [unclassified Paenibacillus]MDN4617268.1 carboxymuconolactone decarboxylase family protein [Paenibacillus sp. PsM32]WDF49993.1 carboxymuconolactone decarboxylase family protein [Paenibacillus sp. KACC 21273]
MSNDRYTQGWNKLVEVDGEAGQRVIDSLASIAPDLGKYIIEFAFGDIYSRDTLTLQQRELITISSLITQGDCAAQLTVHLNASLNVGITPTEIVETIIHCSPYIGFPRVLNAMNIAKDVFAQRGIERL